MRTVVATSYDWSDERAVSAALAWVEAERSAAAVAAGDVVVTHCAYAEDVAAAVAARGWSAVPHFAGPDLEPRTVALRNDRLLTEERPDLVLLLGDGRPDRGLQDLLARSRALHLPTYVIRAAS